MKVRTNKLISTRKNIKVRVTNDNRIGVNSYELDINDYANSSSIYLKKSISSLYYKSWTYSFCTPLIRFPKLLLYFIRLLLSNWCETIPINQRWRRWLWRICNLLLRRSLQLVQLQAINTSFKMLGRNKKLLEMGQHK